MLLFLCFVDDGVSGLLFLAGEVVFVTVLVGVDRLLAAGAGGRTAEQAGGQHANVVEYEMDDLNWWSTVI